VTAPALVLRWVRIEVRRRWRSLTVLTLLVAAVGATVMGAFAGARRGASALDRLQANARPATAVVLANSPDFDWNRIRTLPEVESITTFVVRYSFMFDGLPYFGLAGQSLDTTFAGAFPPADDAVLRTIERPVVLQGRVFDPSRDDEVVVSKRFAASFGKGVGDTLTLTLPSPAELEAGLDATSAALSGPRITMHIVGVVRSPWFSDSVDSPGNAILSPGLVSKHPMNTIGDASNRTNPAWLNALVRLRHGAADLASFRTSVAQATQRSDIQIWNLPERSRNQQREIAFEARCLLAFGGAVLVAALFVIAQAMARYTGGTVSELRALRGSGMTRGQVIALASAAPLAAAVVGAVLAGAIAAGASRWFPIGTARYVEPHPGTVLDWVVLGPVIGFLIVTVATAAAVTARLAANREASSAPVRGSWFAGAAARAGLPVPLVIGTRFALETGKGRSAQPVLPTLIGAVAGVLGVIAALTFSAGVSDAADRPERYGQTFQLGGFFGANGDDYFPTQRVTSLVAGNADIAAVGDVREAIATGAGGGSSLSLFTIAPATKPLRVVVTSGRPPAAPDEVMLAPRSLGPLHAALGSRVRLTADKNTASFRVTGIGFVPQGGPNQVYADGGWLAESGFDRLFTHFRFHFLLADVASGRDPQRVARELSASVSSALGAPADQGFRFDVTKPPIEIVQLRQVRVLPALLGAFLAVLALAAIGHALATAVRRRAPDLAVLRALGMTPWQCRWAIVTQAGVTAVVGLAIGIPVGVALGRWVWRAVADYTPLEYVNPAATLVLLLCAPVTLVLAMLLATLPGRRAARLQVAQVLRAE
jgi:ABC-type lipoprotein release transport system permease subunit